MAEYIPSVGMEVHAELATNSKMFCRCQVAFGGEPNTRTCPVCLGLPGTLPVPNKRAIEMVVRTALALNCTIAMRSIFHRKNYFYPDLPKGYQVSQYGETNPLGYAGYLDLPSGKRVRIRRVHLEEDTGKLMHLPSGGSGVDYNRAGTPLMEIVTDFPPDIASPEDAKEYLSELRQILVYLGVCDGKMEEGSLRCEPNISVRIASSDTLGTKTELKNLNSFRSVQLGVGFEVRRQIAVLEGGGTVLQETRGWNEQKESSFLMRVKEAENDYRYFPDPDLAPMVFTEEYVEDLRKSLPELPGAKHKRYREELGLSDYDAGLLIADRAWANYFEQAVALGGEPKAVCNWMTSDFAKLLNDSGQTAEESKVKPAAIIELVKLVQEGTINGKTAKKVLADAFESGKMPSQIVAESGATQISDKDTVVAAAKEVIAESPDVVAKYRAGQQNVLGFFVGQIMKRTSGRANAKLVQDVIRELLDQE
ncbi:MAG TPA: Asp-tRNA(Asn)/Glu-tRNA(Gln) amidotransferase subunit GatB [Fimbriimonas sp.]|nr:Asp-tRNA(Asn)/Glu-tRNA(Gln) amidotransferase subunit GatB [Fimbriimonas sp.]